MITIELKYLRGTVTTNVRTTSNIATTAFGRAVTKKVEALKEELERWSKLNELAVELEAKGETESADKIRHLFEEGECPACEDFDALLEQAGKSLEQKAAAQAPADEPPASDPDGNPVDNTKSPEEIEKLKQQLEATGGIPTTPEGSFSGGKTTGEDQGVKVTGGEFDPAVNQPQPGSPEHQTNPNEGQDPVDSNPPEGGESAESSKELTDAPKGEAEPKLSVKRPVAKPNK